MSARSQRGLWIVIAIVVAVTYTVGITRGDDSPRTADERAHAIKETTLCPICDGQNVLESNAPIATAIRAQIDELVADGLSDAQIRARLAADFGDDVNAIPPSTGWGALVWVLPVAAAIVAAGVLGASVRRWRTAAARAGDDDVALVAAARRRRS